MLLNECSLVVCLLNFLVGLCAISSLSQPLLVPEARNTYSKRRENGITEKAIAISEESEYSTIRRPNYHFSESSLLNRYYNISNDKSNFSNGKFLLSKFQHNYRMHHHKHHKHHRYRHTKRKKIDPFKIPSSKTTNIGTYFAPFNETLSSTPVNEKISENNNDENLEKNVTKIQRRTLLRNIIDNFYGSVSSKESEVQLKPVSHKSTWFVRNLKQENNQSWQSFHLQNESNFSFYETGQESSSVRNKLHEKKVKLVGTNGKLGLRSQNQQVSNRLIMKPFKIPGEIKSSIHNDSQLWTFFRVNPTESSIIDRVDLSDIRNQTAKLTSIDKKIRNSHRLDFETANGAPKYYLHGNAAVNSYHEPYSREQPLRLFIKKKARQNVRIRKSKEHSVRNLINRTTSDPVLNSIPSASYRMNQSASFVHHSNCLSDYSYATKGRYFHSATNTVEVANLTAQQDPCYNISDLFLVILMTSLVNLLTGIVITFAFCCLPLRECCLFVYGSRIHSQVGCTRNHKEDDNSGSVGCLEACLPDISYQRHIARGFSKGRAFRMAHMFQHMTGSSGDRKPRRKRKDSFLISRRSLSLEDLSAT